MNDSISFAHFLNAPLSAGRQGAERKESDCLEIASHSGDPTPSGQNVETKFCNQILKSSLIIAMVALTGCGTPPAKDFGGRWKPVNHFRTQPTEIPLQAAYTFYAAPMDETLKTMLTRWANDSGRTLSYQLPFDVTLYTPVSNIRTTDLDIAAQQLTTIYAAQHVYVSSTDRKILVLPSSTISSNATDLKSSPAVSNPARPAGSK